MNQATLDKLSPEKRRLLELMLAERTAEKQRLRQVQKADIERVDRSQPIAPSYAQQRLWFLDQLSPGNPAYNIPAAVRLTGVLDAELLASSLQALIDRHENLRTNFVAPDGKPRMAIHERVELPLERIDLSHLEPEAALEEAQSRVPLITNRPFDLSAGPLVRVALMKLADDDHVLLLIMHHIISDVWSFGIFFKELGAVYDARVAGQAPSLPPLPFHYADYAVWQRKVLEGGEHERQLGFWKEQLAGAPTVLELPTDRPRPAQQRFFGGRVPLVIGGGVNDALRDVARSREATLYMANMSILSILLQRLTGQTDLLIGTPVTNRNRTELEAQIGFYVNSLAIRADLGGDPTFVELLDRVRSRCLPAFEHRDLPFERLVQELKIERDMARNPVYQVDFAFQNFPKPYLQTPGLTLSPFEMREAAARVDLEFDLKESNDGFEGFIRFNSDLFDKPTVERLAARFENLLRAVLAAPEQRISQLTAVTAEESYQLQQWNETAEPFTDSELPMHRLIERQAQRAPDSQALISPEETLSYGDFDRRANGLAHRLRALGVGLEDRCAVCLERSCEMVTALYGVWKAGGAYVPLDPDYPQERLDFMLADAGCRVLVTTEALLERLNPGDDVEVVLVSRESMVADAQDDAPEIPEHAADHLAYVIYTSGSTGRPKGAMLTHRGPMNRMLWAQESWHGHLKLGPGDRVIQKTPFSFDVSVWEIFQPLMGGACLVLAKPGGQGDPAYLAELIDEHQVNVMHSVPSMLQVFVDTVPAGSCSSLERVVTSGETQPFELQRRFFARFDAKLHNLYGPTETSIECNAWLCRRDAVSGPTPIGPPISNVHMHVVDEHMQICGIGVPGELLIGGACLARGYHDRPALTAERFIPDPWSDRPGAVLYRSGDKARWLDNGSLDFMGRLDHQVKIRGFRIELGEVESALREHDAVHEAVVLARRLAGTPALVGYITLTQSAADLDAHLDSLREHLSISLPDYMVPSAWVEVDEFPLDPNGKLDRKALPDPQAVIETFVAPRPGVEEALARIWQDLLGITRVGAADNFFNLGGQSLIATQVVARIRDSLGVELPVRTLFEKAVLNQLATAVERAQAAGGAASDAPAMVPVARDAGDYSSGLPLSFAQERLWFIDQLVPNLAAYNIPGAVRMTGDLDPELLEQALDRIVDRHEVLRTTFGRSTSGVSAGRPVQIIAPPGTSGWSIPRLDLRHLPHAEREAEAYAVANALSAEPFDLATGPLMRGTLIRLEERSWFFALIIHHIVYDMWSRDIFLGELVAIYEALRERRQPQLQALPLQYADFAVWQRQWLQGNVLEEQLEYWRRELDGVEPFELPTDHPRPQVQSFAGRRLHFGLSRDVTDRLKRFSQHHGVTLFVSLLGGFAVLLERYTGRRDLAIGSPVANRNRTETEGLMGFFANTLVLRARLEPGMTVAELLSHIRDISLGAYSHQDLPFEKLVNEIQPDRDLSRQPLFQVLFNYLINYVPPSIELPGLRLDPEQIHGGGVPFDLTLSLYEVDGAMKATADYATDLFEEATLHRFFQHYERVLDGLVRSLDAELGGDLPIDRIEALSSDERQHLLFGFGSSTELQIAKQTATVVDRVRQQAEGTPGAAALITHEAGSRHELTYAQLVDRADCLAAHLVQRGVGVDDCVAIALERSAELPLAVLAVLTAGAAYVPLDPSAPSDRLDMILTDARAGLVLTTSDLADRFTTGNSDGGTAEATTERTTVVALDSLDLGAVDVDTEAFEARPRPQADNLAYVLFTSGSTGRPKGVAMTHGAARNLIDWQVADLAAAGTADDEGGLRTLQFASIGFDVSFEEIFSTWATGGSLHMLREDERRDLQAVQRRLSEDQIQRAVLPVVALQELARLASLPSAPELSLERIATSGEQLQITDELRGLMTTLGERHAGVVLDNEYGPSETHVVTRHRLDGAADAWPALPPIGRAISGVRLYVLDARGEPTPLGVPGELAIGGVAPARGYLHRPALTAAAFRPDPFAQAAGEPGARLYFTGDLVRRRADGVLEFLGRLDDQVKIRGFRVEPGEAQAVLDGHGDVEACAVIARRDDGDARLVAYVVSRVGADDDVSNLRAYLAERLPDYLVPSAFVFLDALPVNANGKVDRKALPAPDAGRPDLAARFVEPSTDIEKQLAAIWCDVLGVERVGVHDSFFELGGHSLLATQVVLRLSDAFDVELPLRRLFDRPTVSHLAQAVEAARWASASPADAAATDDEEEGEL